LETLELESKTKWHVFFTAHVFSICRRVHIYCYCLHICTVYTESKKLHHAYVLLLSQTFK